MEKDKKSIQLLLAGREYPLFVTEESEAFIRTTVEKINAEIAVLKENYQGDMQDFLAMYLLMQMTQNEISSPEEKSRVEEQLNSIINLLDRP
ncbi:MAG: cell division protein ZapA [Chitinophagales bacterium]|nr:cell division protein ZapA [Chitinophagales bacterium]